MPCRDARSLIGCSLLVISALLFTPTVRAQDDKCLAIVKINSDPTGAQVYGEDGNDWGQTSNSGPVVRNFWVAKTPYACSKQSMAYTVTLKKRDYKATQHTFTIYYHWYPKDAQEHPQVITVVLDSLPNN